MTADPSTPEGRAELRALCDKATEGTWAIWRDLDHQGFITIGDEAGVLTDEKPYTEECNPTAHVYIEPDAELIVAAVNALPALLDQLDAVFSKLVAEESLVEVLRTQVRAYQQVYERDEPRNRGADGITGLIHRANRAEAALERVRLYITVIRALADTTRDAGGDYLAHTYREIATALERKIGGAS
ncbi:hypothetical protein F8M49_30010 [Rhodococcus zopfii]|uniref:Uncharacterized protein n=1 Tax=Rhodococcus zopfii TaxID=43772 RepID=A0ABU3WXV6_9NOCA|nr:hypothetical protein [Rhodococcus zopfii]MDV2478597.1 hypothetical protein [Rhodococcus zopfii]